MGCFDTVKFVGKMACTVVQFVMFVWAVSQLPGLRDTWLSTVPDSATVLTVQADGFWGPVHVLVPTNCTRFSENDALYEDDEGAAGSQDGEAAMAPAQGEGGLDKGEQRNITERRLDEEQVDEADGVSSNGTHTIVTRCGKTLAFLEPSGWQRFGAVLWLSGKDTMSELRNTRCRMMMFLIFCAVVENAMQLCTSFFQEYMKRGEAEQMILPANGDAEQTSALLGAEQAPQSTGPAGMVLTALKTFVSAASKKFSTMQAQMAMLSLFIIFWHDDHYVTSFIPGKAYLMLFSLYAIIILLPLSVACCGHKATLFFGCSFLMDFLCVWFAVVFPMAVLYNCYQLNYLWNVGIAAEIRKETHGFLQVPNPAEYLEDNKVLRAEWASAGKAASEVASYLFGAHAVEVFLDTFMQVIEPLVA